MDNSDKGEPVGIEIDHITKSGTSITKVTDYDVEVRIPGGLPEEIAKVVLLESSDPPTGIPVEYIAWRGEDELNSKEESVATQYSHLRKMAKPSGENFFNIDVEDGTKLGAFDLSELVSQPVSRREFDILMVWLTSAEKENVLEYLRKLEIDPEPYLSARIKSKDEINGEKSEPSTSEKSRDPLEKRSLPSGKDLISGNLYDSQKKNELLQDHL